MTVRNVKDIHQQSVYQAASILLSFTAGIRYAHWLIHWRHQLWGTGAHALSAPPLPHLQLPTISF